MLLKYNLTASRFEVFNFSERDAKILEGLGFRFTKPKNKPSTCYTTSPEIASKLEQFADENAKALISKHRSNVILSFSDKIQGIEYPCPKGQKYLDYQVAGIYYALTKQNCLIADDPGLGKTIQFIGVINASPWIRRVLVICPAIVKINWERELKDWLTRKLSVEVVWDPKQKPVADIVIINYDILWRAKPNLIDTTWDLIGVDEVQMVKNPEAKRTKAVFGYTNPKDPSQNSSAFKDRKWIALSGTPLENTPENLWFIIKKCDPYDLGKSRTEFENRYCATDNYGNLKPANLEELGNRIRGKFMVRRLKEHVLKSLPPKRRQVIVIPGDAVATLLQQELAAFDKVKDFYLNREVTADAEALKLQSDLLEKQKAGQSFEEYKELAERLKNPVRPRSGDGEDIITAMAQVSTLRRQVATAKVPYAVEYLKLMFQEHKKVVVFAHHSEVIAAIAKEFESFTKVAIIDGKTTGEKRQVQIDMFQKDDKCRMAIVSITTAIGFQLTAGSYGLFLELDWRSTILTQAEDRLHRIGQVNSVLIQHFMFDKSLDSKMVKKTIAKQEIINATMSSAIVA